jgi:uncharacterized cupredoxin-like copper-binding protein
VSKRSYKAACAGAVIPVALLTAGCSSSKTGGGATTSSAAAPTAAASSAASAPAASAGGSSGSSPATAVTVTEKEFSIQLPSNTFTAGTYTFTVHNAGQFPHNLTVDGPGVDDKASPTVGGAGTGSVTVTLQKGSYELYCSVDGHKDKGMDLHVQVR